MTADVKFFACAIGAAVGIAACMFDLPATQDVVVDASTAPDATTSPDADVDAHDAASPPTDAAVDAPVVPCPEAGMVRVGQAQGSFCIDGTEVTGADFMAFLIAVQLNPPRTTPDCDWNTLAPPLGQNGDTTPVTNVNWCDAYAYCVWAGKHLCGTPRGEWLAACSHEGQHVYPYGDTFDPTACNVQNRLGAAAPVGSNPRCVGGYPGIFDMAGNAAEWEDACDDAGVDIKGAPDVPCNVRGGAWDEDPRACDYAAPMPRSTRAADVGFRCCF
jgi:formylglycine-generating enzyme required for sulfatase activity